MNGRKVYVYESPLKSYPSGAPFHPDRRYPEYPFKEIGSETNGTYEAVRGCFRLAGLDEKNFGTEGWSPLGDLIRPGETVLLKPNLIKESHPREPDGWRYVLTHGSVIRAVADYVWKALGGKGKILIADAPQTDSSFKEIVRVLGLDEIQRFYLGQGFALELRDLRREEWTNRDGVIVGRERIPGDPDGYVKYDLGDASEFFDHGGAGRYYGADYDEGVVNFHHTGGRHEYLIAGSAAHCDVIVNLPKLKTHKKAGITVSLKNLVGVNGDKNWLPHHTEGYPDQYGDEHPMPDLKHRLERRVVRFFRRLSLWVPGLGSWIFRHARRRGQVIFGDTEDVIRSGNWWGNDTVWRMCLDLNKIIFYGNPDGTMREGVPWNRKRHYVMVDGIVSGEGRGPMNPDPVPTGIVAFGAHPASVDAACAYLVGFDPDRIPIVGRAFRCRDFPLAEFQWRDVEVVSNRTNWNGVLPEIPDEATFRFRPHFGWEGHIERALRATDMKRAES